MKIIFDFDHTLFSTRSFYEALKASFKKLGVEEELFLETFKKSKRKGRDYKPFQQMKLICRVRPLIKRGELKKEFEKILNKAPEFLYPDAPIFLKSWHKLSDLILLSYGERDFQRKKIKASKIEKYFKKIIVTKDINKTKPFNHLFQNQEIVFFVEDNPWALTETKKVFPEIITVRINRREGKYAVEPNNSQIDFSIKNLKELTRILKKYEK